MFWLKFFFDLKFLWLSHNNSHNLSQTKTQDKLIFQTKENHNVHVYMYI